MDQGEDNPSKRVKVSSRFRICVIPRNVTQVEFGVGDPVMVRPKSRREFRADTNLGTFDKLDTCQQDDETKKMAWIKIGSSETSQRVPCHRLFPVVTPRQDGVVSIVVVYDTPSFRQSAWAQLQPPKREHHVLEVGCSTGETSEILWTLATSWVGLDTSTEMIQRVQETILAKQNAAQLNLRCERLDALVDPPRARKVAGTFHPKGPTDVFLDIGGNRSEMAIWKMLHILCVESLFLELGQVVIKSEELHGTLWNELQVDSSAGPLHLSKLCLERNEAWLKAKVASLGDTWVGNSIQKLPKHPLKAPMRLSPFDGKTPICRFHNYHPKGCSRFKDKTCPYDHNFCHLCLQPCHVARNCRTAKGPRETTK